MTEPPRRKRFQIHLSTAIVMMFAAGGIMWANSIGRLHEVGYAVDPVSGKYPLMAREYGWPFSFADGELENQLNRNFEFQLASSPFLPGFAILDFIVGLSLLSIVWFLCEWLIRLRAARKGS